MPILFADAETASELDVTRVGSEVYARHPSTRTLLWSLRALEWPRSLVFERDGFWTLVREIKRTSQIEWPTGEPLVVIHWSPFDRVLVTRREEAPQGWEVQWLDLQAVSLSYGGPAQLGPAAAWWGGTELKDAGKHLISRFCKPQKDGRWITREDDPIRWERFRSYAGQDTEAMVPIYNRFVELAEAGGHRWADHEPAWEAVRRMNERGIPIDRIAAEAAILRGEAAESRLVETCREEFGITPFQTEAVRLKLGLSDVRKETLEEALDSGGLDPEQKRLAEIRLQTAGAARKKLGPMLAMSLPGDPRVRGAFRYHGAWTRRLSSLGLQAQNFVKGKADEAYFEALVGPGEVEDLFERTRTNIRGFLRAEPGGTLVAADLAQIELRVGGWLAGETWLVEALARGEDAYKITAGALFNLAPGDVGKPSRERDFGKVVELGSMYQLGWMGLQRQAAPQGIDLREDEARRAIEIYRATHPAFVASWAEMDQAFRDLVAAPAGVAQEVLGGLCRLERHETHVRLVRPSGFAQYFWLPALERGTWPDGGERWELSYMGLDKTGRMTPQHTYGGNIFQGAVQGTAADLILEALARVEDAGYHPIMSIHDEIVCEIGDDGECYVDDLCALVAELPSWAQGLPVEAEGWQGKRFTKA